MRRKRRKNKQIKFIMITSLSLLFILTVGYAAFSTNLNITAKGNIIKTPESCFTVSDNGDGTGTITYYNETCGTKIVIPEKINNLTITKIASSSSSDYLKGVFAQKNLEYIKLPKTLKEIGTSAFFANKLSKLEIPNGVTIIGEQAFRSNKLTYLSLPNTLKTIGGWAFMDNQLTEINIPTSVTLLGGGVFTKNNVPQPDAYIYSRKDDGSIDYTKLLSYAATELDSLSLNNQTKVVGSGAFEEIKFKETDFSLPEGITIIENNCFTGTNIRSITIPTTTQYIYNSFTGASELKNITIKRKANAISGSPWGATNATVNWTETN